MPNITTIHAITYTYLEVTNKLQLLDIFAVCLNLFVDSQLLKLHTFVIWKEGLNGVW